MGSKFFQYYHVLLFEKELDDTKFTTFLKHGIDFIDF